MKSENSGRRTIVYAKLSEDFLHIAIHCVHTEGQISGDQFIAVAQSKLSEHFVLTGGERGTFPLVYFPLV